MERGALIALACVSGLLALTGIAVAVHGAVSLARYREMPLGRRGVVYVTPDGAFRF